MRHRITTALVIGALGTGGFLAGGPAVASAGCTPTGFVREGIPMTAAVMNPTSPVTGEVDATGCNIGVYYDNGTGLVSRADVHGANYFGIVVNGDVNAVQVDVTGSTVRDIGETPPNGTQHGVGVYYRAFGTGTASGKITGNNVFGYQKGGIVANGSGLSAQITDNTVTGLGRVAFIAQNGIQVGYGARASVMRNTVADNAYTGPNSASSGGILVVGGPGYGGDFTTGTQIVQNTLTNNDIGIYLSNFEADYSAPVTATNIKAVNNVITNDAITNVAYGGTAYQAGVSDVGNNDKIVANRISGAGYSDPTNGAYAVDADASFTNRPKVHANR